MCRDVEEDTICLPDWPDWKAPVGNDFEGGIGMMWFGEAEMKGAVGSRVICSSTYDFDA